MQITHETKDVVFPLVWKNNVALSLINSTYGIWAEPSPCVPKIRLFHKWHLEISETSEKFNIRLLQFLCFFNAKLSHQDRFRVVSRNF